MALPDSFQIAPQTAVVWGTTSGSGVTLVLTLNNLANAAGRMGASADLGANFEQEYSLIFIVETGTAPTAGLTAECYLAWSYNNSTWPGKVTGSDAAYPTTVAANKKQLGNPSSILVATNDGSTTLVQNTELIIPKGRYVTPVVINLLGQAFRNEGTPANNDSRVILVPRRFVQND